MISASSIETHCKILIVILKLILVLFAPFCRASDSSIKKWITCVYLSIEMVIQSRRFLKLIIDAVNSGIYILEKWFLIICHFHINMLAVKNKVVTFFRSWFNCCEFILVPLICWWSQKYSVYPTEWESDCCFSALALWVLCLIIRTGRCSSATRWKPSKTL